MKTARLALAFLLALAGAAGAAHADTKIVARQHRDAFMGQPAQDGAKTTWIGKDGLRAEDDESVLLILPAAKKMYLCDKGRKSCGAIDIPIDFAKLVGPEEAAQLQAMLTQLKPSVAVKDTGETKQIGAWKTRKYVLTLSSAMVTTEQEIWTTSDVRPDTAGAYRDMLAGMQDALPTMAELAKTTRALEGMPILTISKASVAGQTVTTSQEIVSIDEAAAPSDAYAIPAGYAVGKFNPLG